EHPHELPPARTLLQPLHPVQHHHQRPRPSHRQHPRGQRAAAGGHPQRLLGPGQQPFSPPPGRPVFIKAPPEHSAHGRPAAGAVTAGQPPRGPPGPSRPPPRRAPPPPPPRRRAPPRPPRPTPPPPPATIRHP